MVVQKMSDTPIEASAVCKIDLNSEHDENKSNKRQKLKRSYNSQEISWKSSSESMKSSTEISQDDLDELRNVYKKCKAAVKKIESKYGHLLNEDTISQNEITSGNNCACKFNKKTIFNDDGGQISQDIVPDLHICPKKSNYSDSRVLDRKSNVLIEREFDSLPDDLKELCEILKNDNIDKSYRNKVIEKIKSTRHNHTNIMKFDRKYIIKQLKVKPDSYFEFKGSNISSLPGYPVLPKES